MQRISSNAHQLNSPVCWIKIKLYNEANVEYDKDKVDEVTLALLYLVVWDRQEGLGSRAWKGFDWETMNRLHEKGYILNPKGKAKSVVLNEEGFHKAEELFQKYFVKK